MILNDNSASNNSNRMRLGSLTSAEVGIGKANESGYFLSVGGATKVDSLEVDNNITMNGDTITATNNNGIEIFKNTTDASPVLQVKKVKRNRPQSPSRVSSKGPVVPNFQRPRGFTSEKRFGYIWLKEKEVPGSCRCPGSLGVRPGLSTFLPL